MDIILSSPGQHGRTVGTPPLRPGPAPLAWPRSSGMALPPSSHLGLPHYAHSTPAMSANALAVGVMAFLRWGAVQSPTVPSQHRSERRTKPCSWCKPRPCGGGRCTALGPWAFAPFPLPWLSCLPPTRMEPQQEQGCTVHSPGETPAGMGVPRIPSPTPPPLLRSLCRESFPNI